MDYKPKKSKKAFIAFIILLLLVVVSVGVFLVVKNNSEKKEKEDKKTEEKENKEIVLSIPKTVDGNTEYIEQKYVGDAIPKDLLELIDSLKLDTEVIPEGTGFESNYFVKYKDGEEEIEYVLTAHERLCNTKTNKCYVTEKDMEKIIYSYNPQNVIVKVEINIPVTINHQPTYVNKIYEKDKIPENILDLLTNLEKDSEVIPENVGFQGLYSINVTTEEYERSYILTQHNKLCDIYSKKCYTSDKNMESIFKNLNK